MAKKTACLIGCCLLLLILTSCRTQTSANTSVMAVKYPDEVKTGDKVIVTGIFSTTKGHMGVVMGILIPHFLNRRELALKYKGKWVKVIGILSEPSYPKGELVQRWGGFQLDLESIEIVIPDDVAKENLETLSEGKSNK